MHSTILPKFENEALWLEWRAKGIGASDVPSIMGEGFSTPYELWLEKTTDKKKAVTKAMKDGKENEKFAIEKVEEWLGLEAGSIEQQVAIECGYIPYLRCTLDGLLKDKGLIVEVKCVKGAASKPIKDIPKKYYGQVQMQLYISEQKACVYAEYDIEEKVLWAILVHPDKPYQRKMLKKCKDFWECIEKNTPPPMSEKERLAYLQCDALEGDEEWEEAELEYETALCRSKNAELLLEEAKARLIELSKGQPVIGSKYDLKISYADGAVNLEMIPELRGVDVSVYRASPVKRTSIVKHK